MHSDWRRALSLDFMPNKQHLGVFLSVLGILGAVALLALDSLGGGREGGIGPAQRAALVAMAGAVLVGLSLLKLRTFITPQYGETPARPVEMGEPMLSLVLVAHRLLMGVASLILLFALAVLVAYAVNLMQFPFDYDQGEGFELVDTLMFSQLRLPYQNTEVFPFYSSNYPPFFHIMAAPFVWLFGAEYWYGRLIAVLSAGVAALAIGYAVWREGGRKWIAMLAGLAFLSSNTVYHIAPLFRQHIVMVMFETLSVVILAYAFPARRKGWILLALVLMILAGYTKQLALYSAIALVLWMGLVNPRRAIAWTSFFGVLGVLIFAWLTLATDGEWWRQAIRANANAISYPQVFALFELFWKLHGFLLVPAVLNIAYELYYGRVSLFSVWLPVTLALGGVSSGTWGGGDSYFATAIAGLCLSSGVFLARCLNHDWRGARLRLLGWMAWCVVPVLYMGYGIATFKMPTQGAVFEHIASVLNVQPNVMGRFYDGATWNVGGYARIGYLLTEQDHEAAWRIVALMNETDKLVLSEEAGFSLRAGREVITNPTQLLNLYNAGQYEGTALIAMIEAQDFGLVVLRAQFYPTPILLALTRYYEETERIALNGFDYMILRPRATPLSESS